MNKARMSVGQKGNYNLGWVGDCSINFEVSTGVLISGCLNASRRGTRDAPSPGALPAKNRDLTSEPLYNQDFKPARWPSMVLGHLATKHLHPRGHYDTDRNILYD
jgi:hypothetical protein